MTESHLDTTSSMHLTVLRTLDRIADVLALLLICIPMIFLGRTPIVFVVFSSVVFIFTLLLLKNNYDGKTKVAHSLLITLLLGLGIGLLQLSPIPTLALLLLSIFTVINLAVAQQLLLGFLFFLMAVCSYFIGSQILGLPRIQNTLLNAISVFALFMAAACKYYFVQSKYHAIYERLQRSRMRFSHFTQVANKLARYTPSQVWSGVIQENKEVRLENRRRKLTVFFSDIKGFTDLSETLSAEDLTSFLNTYFDAMAGVAKRHGATIDKFIGDALMVFFGDPGSKGEREDALACVEMAVDMRRELGRLRSHWRALGFDGLDVRMGINTGYCHVGNFGSPTRLSYTAIGREVNLAARIQSVAEPNQILISDQTHELIKHNYKCTKGLPVLLKGIVEPTQVWSVDAIRQGEDKRRMRWVEHEMPGFNLHLNMRNIKEVDRVKIRQMLREASLTLDESIRNE